MSRHVGPCRDEFPLVANTSHHRIRIWRFQVFPLSPNYHPHVIRIVSRIRLKLLVPDENGGDCSNVLQKFVMMLDIPPSNVLEVRQRTYTEAEQRFLDYCDIQLKDQKYHISV